jgi:hypothetical protein
MSTYWHTHARTRARDLKSPTHTASEAVTRILHSRCESHAASHMHIHALAGEAEAFIRNWHIHDQDFVLFVKEACVRTSCLCHQRCPHTQTRTSRHKPRGKNTSISHADRAHCVQESTCTLREVTGAAADGACCIAVRVGGLQHVLENASSQTPSMYCRIDIRISAFSVPQGSLSMLQSEEAHVTRRRMLCGNMWQIWIL